MSGTSKNESLDFSLTGLQKALYALLLAAISALVVLGGSLASRGGWGTFAFILLAMLLGLATFFISSGWVYRLKLTQRAIVIVSRQERFEIPFDRVGMLVRGSVFPYPIYWLVLRNATQGREVPTKRVDPTTSSLIAAYQARNPGKTLTIMPVPAPFVRSGKGLVKALKDRIPPLVVDERLGVK